MGVRELRKDYKKVNKKLFYGDYSGYHMYQKKLVPILLFLLTQSRKIPTRTTYIEEMGKATILFTIPCACGLTVTEYVLSWDRG